MLRKRTIIKPNLNQVAAAPKPPQQPAAQPASAVPPPPPVISGSTTEPQLVKDGSTQPEVTTTTTTSNARVDQVEAAAANVLVVSPTKLSKLEDESSKRVHEAITQLTGQKFEPIKSISLRNSANKNVKLKDLLFFNPPLTKDQKRHKKSIHLAKKNERKRLDEEHQQQNRSNKANDDINNDDDGGDTLEVDHINNNNNSNSKKIVANDEPSLVPKVKLGPEGKLILDESSTFINRKNSIKAQEAIIEDNEEIISRTNYDSYRRKPTSTSQTKWSLEDTQKFYHALTILGTDFSMMESLLFSGHRSRTELHKKFKREERINKTKIDIALSNRISLNSEELDGLRDMFYK